jgi:hypothetical protein
MTNNFEQLIRENVQLGKKASTGFEQLKCPLCSDYKIRAGFKFDNGKISYHCFNCSTHEQHYENSKHLSTEFFKILIEFGISKDAIQKILFNIDPISTFKQHFKNKENKVFEFPEETKLPQDCYFLTDKNDIWTEVANEYLTSRGLSNTDYPWMLSSHYSFRTKLIIPYYRNKKPIYWQAREMDDANDGPRYLNPSLSRYNIIFNFDELFRYTTDPLFVTEGALDSISIGQNSIALLGSSLNDFKIEMLNRVKGREIIFLLDKDKNGKKLGENAIKHNWNIVIIEGEIKDANEALQKMGYLWLVDHLIKNKKSGMAATLEIKKIKTE